jgi:hypothetical protein
MDGEVLFSRGRGGKSTVNIVPANDARPQAAE